jgi:hypothetical protein
MVLRKSWIIITEGCIKRSGGIVLDSWVTVKLPFANSSLNLLLIVRRLINVMDYAFAFT